MKFSLYQLALSINGDNTVDQEIASITAPAPTTAKTYVFVDTNLPDWQSLLSNIPADAKIAFLNSNQNGLSQIAHALKGQTDVQAIHILSHSTAASIDLGSLKLTAQNLAEQSPALKAIGAALTADADILLYGCNIAKGSDGAALIDALALATQADVAASTNSTGPTRLGGDWALEYQTGIINAAQYDFSNYADLLATPSTFNGGSGIKNIYVRPGGTSNTWTFGVGKVWSDLNQSAPITSIGFSNIDFSAPTTDWILTRGIFQYSVSGGAWTNYTASAAALQYDYQTARVNNANTVWRFLDLLPGNSSTADTVAIGWLTSGETTVVTDSVQIIPDLAPTNITQNLTISSTNILSTFAQGAAISTLTPVDTGSTTGGYWAIDSQTNANLFSITSNTALGNTANLTIGSGTMPAAGTPVSVTLRYYDGLQTDGSGNPIGGQGVSQTFNFNIVSGQTQDLANFGSDLNISTAATNSQDYSSVTTLSNGNFVVVWQSDGQGTETLGKNGIYARIYDATGTPQGSEFAITTLNNNVDENFPVVTALDNGRFAVAYNTATGFDIAYRLVAANGTVGSELIANTATANDQFTPSISTLSDGSFIISWTTYAADYSSSEVHAQKFNAADGSKNGVELTITATGESHDYSNITALSNGAYVVTWYDYTIGALKAVVSTAPSTVITLDNNDNAWNPQVTGLTGGGFVVAWESPTTGKNIFFQRFDNAGAAQGAVTQANVNGGAGIDKSGTSIDALSGGGFVITWTSPNDDNDGGGIFGRRFTSTGTAVDATEFQINEFSAGNQFNPKVTALAADAFATVWTDASSDGPNNYGIEGRVLLAPDVTPPTVSIAIADSSVILGETPTVTFTFSEAVTGFTNTDITSIPNGTLSAVSSSDGGVTYTATFTPTAGVQDASNLFTVNMAGVTDAAANAGVGSTNSGNFAIDTQRPDVAITLADSNLTTGETTTVTFTFTEAVTGFTSGDITVIGGGTLGALSTSDNITFTATFTPTPLLDDATNVITVNKVGVNDTAGNAGSGDSSSANYVVATAGPTVTATFSDTSLIIGDTSLVTFTFSEAVTGFSNADLSIVNGSLTPVSTSNGGVTWTATFTPNVSVADTSNVITITNSGYTSVADGNPGTGTTDSNNYSIDTVRPNATVVVTDTTLLAGETSLVTITFNEAVSNFSNADLTIANGSLSAVASGDGGITWTATLTPSTAIADASNLITLDNTTLNDLAGNAGTGTTDSNNYAVQTVRPTVTVAVTDTALKIGDTSTVTFTFSEAVTGFTNGDLTIANGTLSPVITSDGGVTWTATLTPNASVNDASNVISVTNAGYANAVGNTGTGSSTSNNYAVDTARPTATIVVAKITLLAGETSLVTITFNEAVTDFDNSDLSIGNGSLSAVSSSDGGITWTANLTPTVDLQVLDKITLTNSGITDLAGNAGSGSTDSNNYLIETLRPTVSIGVSDTALKIGDTATVTFTFSESVTNFSNADVTFPNGTLSPVASSDGGTTWTATFTPSADIADTSNMISVALASLNDLAGNAGTGTSVSPNYTIDTLRPFITTIGVADGILTIGETTNLSLNFNEAVSGLTISDITVDNAVPSALSTSDGGTTWNFTVTPNASATNLASFVHVNYANVTDTAGNVGVGIGNFGSFVIDTARPALVGSVTVSDNALKIGDTSTVSFAFTEAVTNLTSADLSTPNGSISNLNSADGGITWTATLTPSISVSDSTNVVTLDLTTITDLRGNAGLGTSSSSNYAVDTVRPALASAITLSDSALAIGETATIGFTFTEAVTSFTTADILSPNGALSNLITGDGGITWTATFTPSPSTYSATNILTLDYTGIVDLAGNAGSGSATSSNYVVDTVRPTLASAMTISDAALKIGDTATVTFTFTEAVTNFTTADVTVENGVLSNLSTANSGITWTATLTPNASVTDTSNILTLNYTDIYDLVGNAGTGTATSGNYAIDTLRPTVFGNISFSDNLLTIGETAVMSLAFSEAVTGLTAADFTVPNGALSNLISSDGGITWTATLTPNANINNATNTITLANTGYADLNSNTGTGTSSSLNYVIDTMRPTATITMSDIDLGVIDTALVTFTFTEPVIGFTNADLTLPVTAPMGTLSPVSSSDGGLTWTATYTPPFGLLDTSNLISLNTAGVIDAVGNPGVAVVNSPNFMINTVNIAPSLGGITPSLSTTDSNRILPFSSVTVTDPDIGALVMASIGLDNSIKGSFTANSLALSGFVTIDGGSTYQHTPASPAVIQAAIRSLVFEPNPTRLSVGTSDVATFTIQVKDQYLAVAVDANTTLTISNVNSAPTDILISDANVSQSEGANAIVGLLSATDRNVGDSHTFTLGAANASNDNTKFAVVGNTLKVLNPAAMTEKAYFVTVQATDANGLSFFKQLTINLDDDIGPSITSIETLRSPRPTITTGSYIVKFNESVTGVSIDDFFLTSTDGTTAHLSSVTALTGNAYRVYFDQLVGTGVLNLNLKTSGTGIADLYGNNLPISWMPMTEVGISLPNQSIPPEEPSVTSTANLIGIQQQESFWM